MINPAIKHITKDVRNLVSAHDHVTDLDPVAFRESNESAVCVNK